jgi:hypothetical protein
LWILLITLTTLTALTLESALLRVVSTLALLLVVHEAVVASGLALTPVISSAPTETASSAGSAATHASLLSHAPNLALPSLASALSSLLVRRVEERAGAVGIFVAVVAKFAHALASLHLKFINITIQELIEYFRSPHCFLLMLPSAANIESFLKIF